MRRSWLKRISKRKHADPMAVKAWRYVHMGEDARCACCGARKGMPGVIRIAMHHILNGGRYGRPDRVWNLLALCERWDGQGCHQRLDKGREERAVCIVLKEESDPENSDVVAMLAWVQRGGSTETLPEIPASLPEWIANLRGERGAT